MLPKLEVWCKIVLFNVHFVASRDEFEGISNDISYLLMEHGADIHTKDKNATSILEMSFNAGNADLMEEILRRGI